MASPHPRADRSVHCSRGLHHSRAPASSAGRLETGCVASRHPFVPASASDARSRIPGSTWPHLRIRHGGDAPQSAPACREMDHRPTRRRPRYLPGRWLGKGERLQHRRLRCSQVAIGRYVGTHARATFPATSGRFKRNGRVAFFFPDFSTPSCLTRGCVAVYNGGLCWTT